MNTTQQQVPHWRDRTTLTGLGVMHLLIIGWLNFHFYSQGKRQNYGPHLLLKFVYHRMDLIPILAGLFCIRIDIKRGY